VNKIDKPNNFAKIIRMITVAPIMAFAVLSILFVLRSDIFQGFLHYILSVVFLTILPILAYPLQPFIPGFRGRGREGQRDLAIVMAVTGYLCSIVSALCFNAPKTVWLIYLTYLISGIGILFFNKVLKIRASGHACGVTGPLAILIYFIGIKGFIGAIILIPVYWACIKMKRHTITQLFWGTAISVSAFLTTAYCIL
jgi:hypothetical protein